MVKPCYCNLFLPYGGFQKIVWLLSRRFGFRHTTTWKSFSTVATQCKLSAIDGNIVIFETRYYYYFIPSFQKKTKQYYY